MPVPFTGFTGPSNRDINIIADCEESINLYCHKIDAGTPKLDGWNLIKRPGYRPFVAIGSGAIKAIFTLAGENGRTFAVSGTLFCELYPGKTYVVRGEVETDGNMATISSNGLEDGHQLFITSGGYGYIFDLIDHTLTLITDDNFPYPVSMGTFSSSYFVALKSQSNQINFSALLNGLAWNGLDVARTSLTTDNKIAMIANHAELWLLGNNRSEVWVNTGDRNTPFQPIPGTVIEGGIGAKWSVQRLDNTIWWVSGDERGANMLWTANGYTPQKASSFAIDWELNQQTTTTNSIAWTYQQAGHSFYCLYVPQAKFTYVYDVATGVWHKRALWNDTTIQWEPDVGQCHAYAFGKHLVGDRRIGMIYEMSLDYYDDEIAKVRLS